MPLWDDLRYAARTLRAAPGFALAAVLSLAVGVGINTSLFAALYAVAFRPLPVRDPARVVVVHQAVRLDGPREVRGSPLLLSYPEYRAYREGAVRAGAGPLAGLAAYAATRLTLGSGTGGVGAGGDAPDAVDGLFATCDYFAVLGAPEGTPGGRAVALGRGFAPDECRAPGAGPVVVLSDALWRTRFGADPAVVGRTVTLNDHPLTVVGVAAPAVVGTELEVPALWVPLEMQPALEPAQGHLLAAPDASWLHAVGRLRPGASRADAQAVLAAVARVRDAEDPGRATRVTVSAGALLTGPEVWAVGLPPAAGLLALAALVLGLACANVATLLLARAAARAPEVAVRVALGAGRGRLLRQFLTEAAVLSAAGSGLGLLLAYWLPPLLLAALPTPGLRVPLTPDRTVAVYAAALAVACMLLAGLAPALQTLRADGTGALAGALRGGRGTGTGVRHTRLRAGLVVAQVAGCVVLLVVTGLLVRGVRRGQALDPGYATADVWAVALDLAAGDAAPARAAAVQQALVERVRALPGVTAVALAARLPLAGRSETPVALDGAAPVGGAGGGRERTAIWTAASPAYFRVLGLRLLRGRVYDERDAAVADGGQTPAVVNAALAGRLWPGRDPLGAGFRAGDRRYRVVGVAVTVQSVRLGTPDGPAFYAPPAPVDVPGLRVVVRAAGPHPELARLLPRAVHVVDPGAAATVTRLDDLVARALQPARAGAALAAALGALALVLAVVGLHGVVAYTAARRTREFGLRLALGARPRDVLALVLRQGARLAAAGLALGAALAAVAARALAGVLFGLPALDPVTFAAVAAGVAAVALAAAAAPAWRAAGAAPGESLRNG